MEVKLTVLFVNNPISNFTLWDGLICGSFFSLDARDHYHNLPKESTLACVAGAWKQWAQERTGHARETRLGRESSLSPHVFPRTPCFLHQLLPNACYTAGLPAGPG